MFDIDIATKMTDSYAKISKFLDRKFPTDLEGFDLTLSHYDDNDERDIIVCWDQSLDMGMVFTPDCEGNVRDGNGDLINVPAPAEDEEATVGVSFTPEELAVVAKVSREVAKMDGVVATVSRWRADVLMISSESPETVEVFPAASNRD